MEVPNQLRLALERELRGRDGPALARAVAGLSARYRQSGGGPVDPLAYAVARMPATFAAVAAALRATLAALPGSAPRSLLDVGAGTGAALWAADATWASLTAATMIEGSQAMIELGVRLAARGAGALAAARWKRADLAGPWEAEPHDLVSAAYVLGELPESARAPLVAHLWECTAQVLVLVEPGTPRGWATIRGAREQLRAAGAWFVAPCPHAGPCPMPADPAEDWCHFAQRLARSKAHRSAKGAALGFEDEKFAYLVVARQPATLPWARILRHPATRPGRIELALCARDGLQTLSVTRAERETWRLARDLAWGDAIPLELVR